MSVIEPSKIPVPFGENGLRSPIPSNSDPVTGRAGYSQGFPAINMTPKEAGGIPPFGQDFNGILYDITKAIRYEQQGGFYTYDNAFAAAIGGYKKGSILIGKISTALYQNQIDGNVTDPESVNASGWSRFGPNSYGLPMIGELVFWPSASMPQEIWPNIGGKFIPYMGQSFSKELYPLLADIYPSGTLPADMRGEFIRGWDNGRGVDPSRALLSGQASSVEFHSHALPTTTEAPSSTSGVWGINDSAWRQVDAFNDQPTEGAWTGTSPGKSYAPFTAGNFQNETRTRNISWNIIVRAS